jgi:hypothetical protein
MVTWVDDAEIVARRYDSSGGAVGGDFQVNSYTTGSQAYPSIAVNTAGTFIVAWHGGAGLGEDDIAAQLINSAGSRVNDQFMVNTFTTEHQRDPSVAINDSGLFLVVWDSRDQDGDSHGVYGQFFVAPIFADGFESGDTYAWSSAVPEP